MSANKLLNWLDEPIEELPGGKGWYRLFCLILCKRRMTYANMYILTYALNKRKFKDNETVLKEKILTDLAKIYYHNNKHLPDGFEFIQ
jgi:hypothetical protein